MKWLIRIVLVLVLLVILAGVGGFIMIDSIATAAVTKGAAFATQTDADCEKVDIKVFGSSATISNLDIKNPDGPFLKAVEEVAKELPEDKQQEYRDAFNSFLVLGNGSLDITVGDVLADKIEIDKVDLKNIDISLIGKDGKKNYELILESLKRFQGDSPPDETKDEKQVVIKELIISNITVYYYFDEDPALGAIAVGPKKITIADDEPMVLTDVGSGGVPMSQITADIIGDVLVQVMANMGDDLGNHVLGLTASLTDSLGVDQVQSTLNDLGITDFDLGKQFEELGKLGGEYGEKAGEFLKEGGDLLKNLGGNILGNEGDDADESGEEAGGVLDLLNR